MKLLIGLLAFRVLTRRARPRAGFPLPVGTPLPWARSSGALAMPETQEDETLELLRRWNAGDRKALEALLARHLGALHKYIRAKLDRELRPLRRDQDSTDLVHMAAARVLEYTPAFIPENGRQFHRLLRKIVLNDLLNQLRSPRFALRQRSRDRFGDSVLDLRANPLSSMQPDREAERAEHQSEARAWARMALEFLVDEQDRRLVLLAAVEECSWKDIGEELGLSADAARMRYHRLLPKLANHIRVLREGRVDELLEGEGG